ncbi:MAG: MBL fold metallo-hydrolase [Bdellovibrionales bacterium]|nr:MBL fold metallo-hydrolase [Bdellovibrionales bacterium]
MAEAISFWGAASTVTGSRHCLELGTGRVLVDCGLFQGLKELRLKNRESFPVDPASIQAVILTHAHLDHSGALPLLWRQGFRGPIFATAPTAELTELILKDFASLEKEFSVLANRRGFSRHAPALPIYEMRDVVGALRSIRPVPLKKWTDIGGGARFRFSLNGHILGSAFVEVESRGRRIVFSGDMGRPRSLLMKPPSRITRADYLVMESTYGDRVHPKEDVSRELERVVIQAVTERKGPLLIPSFAVGRAQDLMYLLADLKQRKRIPDVPILLDSPMATDATVIFCKYPGWHRLPDAQVDLMCRGVRRVRDFRETLEWSRRRKPMIVIAGSGMVAGGRVLQYLAEHLNDPRATVLFSGFQALGTRGRLILDGAPEVKMLGRFVAVKAKIENLRGLSAHADQAEILGWLRGLVRAPRRVFLVHGEPQAAAALRLEMEGRLGWPVETPHLGERFPLA